MDHKPSLLIPGSNKSGKFKIFMYFSSLGDFFRFRGFYCLEVCHAKIWRGINPQGKFCRLNEILTNRQGLIKQLI